MSKLLETAEIELRTALETEFANLDAASTAYLAAMDNVTLEGQQTLMAMILTRHSLVPYTRKNSQESLVSDADRQRLGQQVIENVRPLITQARKENKSTLDTASVLWNGINALGETERIVAMTFILDGQTNFVPYAALPDDSSNWRPRGDQSESREKLYELMAIVSRVLRYPVNEFWKATIVTRCLDDCEDEMQKVLLLQHALKTAAQQKSAVTSKAT